MTTLIFSKIAQFFCLPDNDSVIAQEAIPCDKTEFTCCANLCDHEYRLYQAPLPQEEQISRYSPSNPQILHPFPEGESLLVVPVVTKPKTRDRCKWKQVWHSTKQEAAATYIPLSIHFTRNCKLFQQNMTPLILFLFNLIQAFSIQRTPLLWNEETWSETSAVSPQLARTVHRPKTQLLTRFALPDNGAFKIKACIHRQIYQPDYTDIIRLINFPV